MIWWLLAWLLASIVLALVIGGAIRRRNRQVPRSFDRQCPVRLEDGRRCKWYRTHPEGWGHSGWSQHG